jgi:hypothetical protein
MWLASIVSARSRLSSKLEELGWTTYHVSFPLLRDSSTVSYQLVHHSNIHAGQCFGFLERFDPKFVLVPESPKFSTSEFKLRTVYKRGDDLVVGVETQKNARYAANIVPQIGHRLTTAVWCAHKNDSGSIFRYLPYAFLLVNVRSAEDLRKSVSHQVDIKSSSPLLQ